MPRLDPPHIIFGCLAGQEHSVRVRGHHRITIRQSLHGPFRCWLFQLFIDAAECLSDLVILATIEWANILQMLIKQRASQSKQIWMEARTSVRACSIKRHSSSSELHEAGKCGTDIFWLTTIVTLEQVETAIPNQLNLTYVAHHDFFCKCPRMNEVTVKTLPYIRIEKVSIKMVEFDRGRSQGGWHGPRSKWRWLKSTAVDGRNQGG